VHDLVRLPEPLAHLHGIHRTRGQPRGGRTQEGQSMSLETDGPGMMRRREILRRAAWLLGGAISAPAALAVLQGCSARASADTVPPANLKFLSAAQFAVVAEIAEIMLPKTDTAGARDAG